VKLLRCLTSAIILLAGAAAQPTTPAPPVDDTRPKILREIGIDQRLDAQLPLDAQFLDETGKQVRLGDYFGHKPVIVMFAYYQCPMLCNEVLAGMTAAFKVLSLKIDKDFEVVTISIDPRETPAMAADKKASFLARLHKPPDAAGWHFLVGKDPAIHAMTEVAGFRYAFDERTGQFAHSSAIMVATPQGKLSRYFYGIEFAPRDLRLALVEASSGKIGNIVDQITLYCYHYDPTTGKYGPVIMNILRLAGLATVAILGGFIIVMNRRERAMGRS